MRENRWQRYRRKVSQQEARTTSRFRCARARNGGAAFVEADKARTQRCCEACSQTPSSTSDVQEHPRSFEIRVDDGLAQQRPKLGKLFLEEKAGATERRDTRLPEFCR